MSQLHPRLEHPLTHWIQALLAGAVIGLAAATAADAADLYVAPGGSDDAPGTLAQPTTLVKAIGLVQPGSTIHLRGGTYAYVKEITIVRGNDGTASARKQLFAYGDEKPVLDFSSQPYGKTSKVMNPRGLNIQGHYWHVRGIEVKGSADNGIYVAGNHNIVELCISHSNRDTGIQIGRYAPDAERSLWPVHNLILNCTAYDNYDPPPNKGENADGFAAKLTVGPGNTFRGCVAHNNIDDGWDLFAKPATGPIDPVTIDQCIAYANGRLTNGTASKGGDRNGFKLGGSDIPGAHVVTRSIAFDNGKNGFTWNSNPGAIRMINNLAFDNAMGNFKFDVNGPLFINNLSFWTPAKVSAAKSDRHGGVGTPPDTSNCWYDKAKKIKSINAKGIVVTQADLLSLTMPPGGFRRLPNGDLDLGDFGLPAPGSQLIDAGEVPVLPDGQTLPFDPAAYYKGLPDIGAREASSASSRR